MRKLNTLTLRAFPNREIEFCDERERESYFASVTLSTRDESWGEFLSREDIERLHSWCTRLLDGDS